MSWLFIEPQFDGHHYTYLERLVGAALDRGRKVIVGVASDRQGEMTTAGLTARFGAERLEFVSIADRPPHETRSDLLRLVRGELAARRFQRAVYEEACRRGSIELVFLPYMDRGAYATGILGSPFRQTQFCGIVMGFRFHFASVGLARAPGTLDGVKAALFSRFLRIPTLRNVFTIDETLPELVAAEGVFGWGKVVYVPDPADLHPEHSREEARELLDLPAAPCAVLAYGFLDARKRIDQLLDWVRSTNDDTMLLAVGDQSDEVAAILNGNLATGLLSSGRLRIVRRFVTEDEEALYFRASDVVWLGYESFDFMSGVLVRAAQDGLAVAFHDRGLIGRYVGKYGAAVETNCRCERLYQHVPESMKVMRFLPLEKKLPDHSWANAIRIMMDVD